LLLLLRAIALSLLRVKICRHTSVPQQESRMSLSNQQRRYLRGLTHALNPVVTIAGKGLSETVLTEIETALARHELIKIRLRSDRDTRAAWISSISQQFAADLVQQIGHTASFYRRNSKKPVIEMPVA
jgi:RNA-binding protein